jgi:ubiquinone biosynthesis protein COQ4
MAPKIKGYPRRPMRPIDAVLGMRALIADKEDTSQVFRIVRALTGNSSARSYAKFLKTDVGRKAVDEKFEISSLLGDREYLKALPEGSVGREYHNFLTRENISLEGLKDESENDGVDWEKVDPGFVLYMNRSRDLHDMYHVLTGYGRDPFGEVCVLKFTVAQDFNLGLAFIAWVGAGRIQKEFADAPVKKAAAQATAHGNNADWIIALDWEKTLSRQLEDVRAELKIAPPHLYSETFTAMVAGGGSEAAVA